MFKTNLITIKDSNDEAYHQIQISETVILVRECSRQISQQPLKILMTKHAIKYNSYPRETNLTTIKYSNEEACHQIQINMFN